MKIFNPFAVANDYNCDAQWPNGSGRRFFLPTICLSSEFFLYLNNSVKKIIKFSFKLIYEQVN